MRMPLEDRLEQSKRNLPVPNEEITKEVRATLFRRLTSGEEQSAASEETRRGLRAWPVNRRRVLTLVVATAIPCLVLGGMLTALVWPGSSPARANAQASRYPGPTFTPADGWTTLVSSEAKFAPSAWASSVPIDVSPSVFETALDEGPLADLPPNGIVILVSLSFPERVPAPESADYPNRTLPLQISDAEIRTKWLGQPNPDIVQYFLNARLKDQWVDIRIYFGAPDPGDEGIETAQDELDRLTIPDPSLFE